MLECWRSYRWRRVFGCALAGKLQWSGRSLTLLDPTYASKYIPIIASVGEHQPTVWSAFYFSLGPAMLFIPLGVYYSFQKLNAAFLFMIVYSTFAFYFSGIMVRLLLTLAPAACYLSAVGASGFMHKIVEITRRDPAESPQTTVGERLTRQLHPGVKAKRKKIRQSRMRATSSQLSVLNCGSNPMRRLTV